MCITDFVKIDRNLITSVQIIKNHQGQCLKTSCSICAFSSRNNLLKKHCFENGYSSKVACNVSDNLRLESAKIF